MAKRKSKKKPRKKSAESKPVDWGGPATPSSKRLNVIIGALAVVAVAGLAWYWIQSTNAERDFMGLAEAGRDQLEGVQSHRNDGRRHLDPGEGYIYQDAYPTSGPHEPVWTEPGFYAAAQPPTRVVHALEHGNVVIYYDRPDDEVMATIRDWVSLYPGQWDGLVAVPTSGLGEAVLLNAWTKSLKLDPFDPVVAAGFIDTYRGRGPENPVR